MILCLGVFAYGAYNVWHNQHEYEIGNSLYDEIAASIVTEGPASERGPAETPGIPEAEPSASVADTPVEIPAKDIDFDALRAINQDAIAWLYSPNTVIDYPVMHAKDYNQYLYHLPDGTYNLNGSLFLDYNNAPDFSDRLSVIYGHHMKSGRMFGTLVNYKSQSYYDEYPYMYLYTPGAGYRVDLACGVLLSEDTWIANQWMLAENADSLIEYAMENSTFSSDVEIQWNDRVVVLSTCSYEYNNARYIVIGVLREGRSN